MKSVLILDDDLDLCQALRETFLILGAAKCVCATSFMELQSLADEALRCDIAVLDVNLGSSRPSGIDAYEWLLSKDFRGRVAFFTGHARFHPLVQRALKFEGVKIIEKPAPVQELDELLR